MFFRLLKCLRIYLGFIKCPPALRLERLETPLVRRNHSKVWEFFRISQESNWIAICIVEGCKNPEVSRGGRNMKKFHTSSQIKHMQKHHRILWEEATRQEAEIARIEDGRLRTWAVNFMIFIGFCVFVTLCNLNWVHVHWHCTVWQWSWLS